MLLNCSTHTYLSRQSIALASRVTEAATIVFVSQTETASVCFII